jgi:hypothetical protein
MAMAGFAGVMHARMRAMAGLFMRRRPSGLRTIHNIVIQYNVSAIAPPPPDH